MQCGYHRHLLPSCRPCQSSHPGMLGSTAARGRTLGLASNTARIMHLKARRGSATGTRDTAVSLEEEPAANHAELDRLVQIRQVLDARRRPRTQSTARRKQPTRSAGFASVLTAALQGQRSLPDSAAGARFANPQLRIEHWGADSLTDVTQVTPHLQCAAATSLEQCMAEIRQHRCWAVCMLAQ